MTRDELISLLLFFPLINHRLGMGEDLQVKMELQQRRLGPLTLQERVFLYSYKSLVYKGHESFCRSPVMSVIYGMTLLLATRSWIG